MPYSMPSSYPLPRLARMTWRTASMADRRSGGSSSRYCRTVVALDCMGSSYRAWCGAAQQVAVVVRRAAWLAVGHEGVARDVADAHPADALVQARGVAAGDGVEHQQRLAAVQCRRFRGPHQRRAQAT